MEDQKKFKKKEKKRKETQHPKMQRKHAGSLRALYKLEAETSEVQGPGDQILPLVTISEHNMT